MAKSRFPKYIVTLVRHARRKSAKAIYATQVDYLIKRAMSAGRGDHWNVKKSGITIQTDSVTCTLNFQKDKGRIAAEEKQWDAILMFLMDTGKTSQFGAIPWLVEKVFTSEEGKKPVCTSQNELYPAKIEEKEFEYGDLVIADPAVAFAGLYGVDDQIYRIMQNIRLAELDMSKRQHMVFHGPPGSGKSTMFDGIRTLVGDENVLRIDATATTAAGAVKTLLERRNVIPPIVQIEEIEKRGDGDLDWLLGATDQREEIRKMNFHVQDARKVQFLAMCTVNDMEEFRKRCKGALQSRFADTIYFPHPGREIMGQILAREITDLGDKGDSAWIEPALLFAYDKLGLTDPRKVKAICLNGREDLMNGKYQEAFIKTVDPQDYPKLQKGV